MTLVTVDAVVYIPSHALVTRVGLGLRVAIRALEDRVVIRVRVAGRTHVVGSAVTGRESRVLRVIEARVQPVRRAMAVLAGRGEELGLRRMPGIRRIVVVLLVAANTGGWERGVVIIHVAVDALTGWYGVRAGQRKRRVVMVKGGIGPYNRVMAKLTLLRKSSTGMIGIRGALEVLQMARDAGGAVQVVIVSNMAVRALPGRHGMRSGQGEARRIVVELGIGPQHRIVACLAGRRKSCRSVGNRTDRGVVVIQVTRDTRRIGDAVVIVDVAVGALARRRCVRPGERESRRAVIEGGIQP